MSDGIARRAASAAVTVAIVLAIGVAHAQRLPLRIYTTAEGLANGRVIDATQDRRGFLWFATIDGLSRFDGARFDSFGVADGVPDPNCHDVLATRDGAIWVATDVGIARLDLDTPGIRPRFTPVHLGTEDPAAYTLFEDSGGALWVGASNGLWRVDPGGAAPVAVPLGADDHRYVDAIAEDRDHSLWLGTSSGLVRRLPDGTITNVRYEPAGVADDRTTALLLDHAGRLWVGGANTGPIALVPPPTDAPIVADGDSLWQAGERNGRALRPDGTLRLPEAPGEIVRYTPDDGFLTGGIRRLIFEDSHGTLWFGGLALVRLIDDRFERLGVRQGFPPEDFAPCLEDATGNLWFGANTVGAIRLSSRQLVSFDERDGLASRNSYAFAEDAAGAVYTISYNGRYGLDRFDGDHFTSVFPKIGVGRTGKGAWGWHQVAFPDRDGRWWYATAEGLAHYPAVARTEELATAEPEFFPPEVLPGRDVFRVFEDSRGDLWISTMSHVGLARWTRATNTIAPVTAPDLPTGVATGFREDPAGNVWIGYDDGRLARLPGGSTAGVRVFGTADGLPDRSVEAMALDHLGRLWIATNAGVARVDDIDTDHPVVTRYGRTNGLSTDQTTSIVEDDRGRIYIGSVGGLDVLDLQTGEVEHLSTSDGLPNDYVMTLYRDRRGQIWVGTRGGVSRIRSNDLPAGTPPPAYLVSLVAGGVPRALAMGGARTGPSLTLGSDDGQLDIEFTSPSFAVGTPVLFQTRLEGADRDWSPPGSAREVHYAHLAPGHYRFWVRAVFRGGATSTPAMIAFEVESPMWRRPWFLALVATGLGLIGWALYRMRLARLLAVERVRTRIATDLHDDLGSSLSRISILAEVAARRGPDQDGDTIDDIGRSARELVDVAADIVWSTDPQRDDLGSLLVRLRTFAGDLLEGRDIGWNLAAPTTPERIRLGPDQRRHLYLVLKEAVNNAARHSGARRVTIEVRLDDGDVLASVTDDGCGLDPTRDRTGNGLTNMRERARQAGGTLTVERAPGGGTLIALRIPTT